jgi:hypothetical protein
MLATEVIRKLQELVDLKGDHEACLPGLDDPRYPVSIDSVTYDTSEPGQPPCFLLEP